jgi:hypothetical protein
MRTVHQPEPLSPEPYLAHGAERLDSYFPMLRPLECWYRALALRSCVFVVCYGREMVFRSWPFAVGIPPSPLSDVWFRFWTASPYSVVNTQDVPGVHVMLGRIRQ